MNIFPHKRTRCTSKCRCDYREVEVFRTLAFVVATIALAINTDCCCCWSIREAPKRVRAWMLSETSEKRAKECILNGTLKSFFACWCIEVDKKNLARNCCQIGDIFCPKTNTVRLKTFPQYCGKCRSRAFIYWILVGTRTYMDVHVASGRMTKTRGGVSGYDYSPVKINTAALRVAASSGPRRWWCIISLKSTWFVLSCKQYRYVRVSPHRPHTAMIYYTQRAFCLWRILLLK